MSVIFRRRELRIETERMVLRPPQMADWRAWAALRVMPPVKKD